MKISYCEVPQGQADPEVMYQSHEVNEDLLYSSEASLTFLMQKNIFSWLQIYGRWVTSRQKAHRQTYFILLQFWNFTSYLQRNWKF